MRELIKDWRNTNKVGRIKFIISTTLTLIFGLNGLAFIFLWAISLRDYGIGHANYLYFGITIVSVGLMILVSRIKCLEATINKEDNK